jgi:hypothetical protein
MGGRAEGRAVRVGVYMRLDIRATLCGSHRLFGDVEGKGETKAFYSRIYFAVNTPGRVSTELLMLNILCNGVADIVVIRSPITEPHSQSFQKHICKRITFALLAFSLLCNLPSMPPSIGPSAISNSAPPRYDHALSSTPRHDPPLPLSVLETTLHCTSEPHITRIYPSKQTVRAGNAPDFFLLAI